MRSRCAPRKEFVEMKAKEKGIDLNDKKNNPAEQTQTRRPGSFNAFRQLKDAKYEAKRSANGGRRDRGPSKPEDIPEDELVVQYEGKEYKITKEGTLVDPESLTYKQGAVLGFSNLGSERFSHMDVKVGTLAIDVASDELTSGRVETSLRYSSTYFRSC